MSDDAVEDSTCYAAVSDNQESKQSLIADADNSVIDEDDTGAGEQILSRLCVSCFLHVSAGFMVLPTVAPMVVDLFFHGAVGEGSRCAAFVVHRQYTLNSIQTTKIAHTADSLPTCS